MNTNTQGLRGWTPHFAMVFISLCLTMPGLQAQTIYKCGNSYSQVPCPGASALNLNDAREPAQKLQTDDATRRDAKLAKELVQNRTTQEKLAQTPPPAAIPAATPMATPSTNNVASVITPKRIQPKHKKPAAFVALVPGTEKPPVKKKTSRGKTDSVSF